MALVMPWFELLAGLALILGIWTRTSAALVGALLLVFVAAISANLLRGNAIDCGCFDVASAGKSVAERFADMRLGRRPRRRDARDGRPDPLGDGAEAVREPVSPLVALARGHFPGRDVCNATPRTAPGRGASRPGLVVPRRAGRGADLLPRFPDRVRRRPRRGDGPRRLGLRSGRPDGSPPPVERRGARRTKRRRLVRPRKRSSRRGTVAVGDFDGDGILDAVSVQISGAASSVVISPGRRGRRLPGRVVLPGGGRAVRSRCRRFRRRWKARPRGVDGGPDVWLYRGDGHGGFGAPYVLRTSASAVSRLYTLDVDEDGRSELLASGTEGFANEVFSTYTLGSGGSFRETAGPEAGGSQCPFDVAIGDVDGDGHAERSRSTAMSAAASTASSRSSRDPGAASTPGRRRPPSGVRSSPTSTATAAPTSPRSGARSTASRRGSRFSSATAPEASLLRSSFRFRRA